MALLGRSLLGQKRYAEAEPPLVSGYEGLKRSATTPAVELRVKQAFKALAQLYEAAGWSEKAAELKRGKLAEAEAAFRIELERARPFAEDGDPRALNELAWGLATHESPNLRDGSVAVNYAERAVAATHRKVHAFLDTLAAAYASTGQFARAVSAQEEAIALVGNENELKQGYLSRLKLFQSGVPYLEREAQDD